MWMRSDSLKIYCCMNYTTMIVTRMRMRMSSCMISLSASCLLTYF